MKVGFYIRWPKGQFGAGGMNVLGDELYGESMCRALAKTGDFEAELYAPNHQPGEKLDVMVYLNDTVPNRQWARRHVLYMQNAYGTGSDTVLQGMRKAGYDGYAFISNKLLELHRQEGFDGIFLPFGVNTDLFFPREKLNEYDFDAAYIGNDIKGEERTVKYLLPAAEYNFGLYGNWAIPPVTLRERLKFWRRRPKVPAYREAFARISKGKIPQERVADLYGSARINLNCTLQDCVDWDVITLRTYEVLACKGFLITDRVAVAEATMEGCMVFTDGGADLTEKIRYYLAHEGERAAIAARGYEYVIKHATIDKRMSELAAYLRSLA